MPTDSTPASRLSSLARLCRTTAVRESLERLGALLCHSLDAAGLRWQAFETSHALSRRSDGCDACCTVALLERRPRLERATALPTADFALDLTLRTHLNADWTVEAQLTDKTGKVRLPRVRFWRRAQLPDELWHLNTSLTVLEHDGLFDDWEQGCLLEAAEFVAPALV
jgi:hypothetical protein